MNVSKVILERECLVCQLLPYGIHIESQVEAMNVTEQLSAEHRLILKVIGHLEEDIGSAGASIMDAAESYLRFIKEYADKYHHDKEEKILFKALQEPGVLSHCNPIPQMLHEHEEGRAFVQEMESAVMSRNLSEFSKSALGYCSLLREHIFKEDNILYPMCEQRLNPQVKAKILDEYDNVEIARGPDFVIQFEKWIENYPKLTV